MKLIPAEVNVVRGDAVTAVAVAEIRKGDMVLVRPGEKIPVERCWRARATWMKSMLTDLASKSIDTMQCSNLSYKDLNNEKRAAKPLFQSRIEIYQFLNE